MLEAMSKHCCVLALFRTLLQKQQQPPAPVASPRQGLKRNGAVREMVSESIGLGKQNASVSDIRSLLLRSDPNCSVSESYEYIERLGNGGFGEVFRARHVASDEIRAIKQIPLSGVQEDMKYVYAELEAMIRLNHPNVVKLYEFLEDKTMLYLATEICEEGDFSNLNNGINDPAEINLLFQDLMMAVAYCHDLGIAHRDLKFSNCLIQKVTGLRRVGKVIDFGLAAIRRPGDHADDWLNDVLGSEYFVAPEVIEGSRNYGVKCDCWAVGVMLYVVLTDEHPFVKTLDGHSRAELFNLIIRGRVRRRPLEKVGADASSIDLIFKLLKTDPDERLDARAVLHHDWFKTNNFSKTWHSDSQMDLQSFSLTVTRGFKRLLSPQNNDSLLSGDMLSRMRAFADYSSFERALLTLVAHYANSKDVEEARAAFEQLNTSKSGSLSREELEMGICRAGFDLRREDVDEVFQSLDDRSGRIHYTKFVAATVEPALLTSANMMDQVYMFFDPKQKGKANKEELCKLLGCDATMDEVPNESEFKALLRQVAKNMKRQCDGIVNTLAKPDDIEVLQNGAKTWISVYGGDL